MPWSATPGRSVGWRHTGPVAPLGLPGSTAGKAGRVGALWEGPLPPQGGPRGAPAGETVQTQRAGGGKNAGAAAGTLPAGAETAGRGASGTVAVGVAGEGGVTGKGQRSWQGPALTQGQPGQTGTPGLATASPGTPARCRGVAIGRHFQHCHQPPHPHPHSCPRCRPRRSLSIAAAPRWRSPGPGDAPAPQIHPPGDVEGTPRCLRPAGVGPGPEAGMGVEAEAETGTGSGAGAEAWAEAGCRLGRAPPVGQTMAAPAIVLGHERARGSWQPWVVPGVAGQGPRAPPLGRHSLRCWAQEAQAAQPALHCLRWG